MFSVLDTIKVRFFETIDGDPDSEEIVWNEYGQFSPNDVHHQFGIVLRTPQYKKLDISKKTLFYTLEQFLKTFFIYAFVIRK